MTTTDPPDEPVLRIISIIPTHPQGFGGHVFEYESHNDLFRCVQCGGYEIALRDRVSGEIPECPDTEGGPSL